jgi:hypothetical protein
VLQVGRLTREVCAAPEFTSRFLRGHRLGFPPFLRDVTSLGLLE